MFDWVLNTPLTPTFKKFPRWLLQKPIEVSFKIVAYVARQVVYIRDPNNTLQYS